MKLSDRNSGQGDMTVSEQLLHNNQEYAKSFDGSDGQGRPSLGVAIVACMDARLDVTRALGLEPGQAHIIRNAGGVVTDDVIRSLTISQRLLGTREIVLVHHTDCGMGSFDDDELGDVIATETGVRPHFELGSFDDASESVRSSIRLLRASPFLPRKDAIRGFVFDVRTGRLGEVGVSDPA